MQWSRVKSILIVILLLVNGFLMATLGAKALFVMQREQEMRQHMQIILQRSDMTLARAMKIPQSALMPQLSVDRSRADEAELARGLLGGEAARWEDGEETRFESSRGEVVWNTEGEISARLMPAGYQMPASGEVGGRAMQVLQEGGLYLADADWETEGNAATVQVRLAGYAVFNRTLTVTFSEKEVRLGGCWTFNEPYATKSDFYHEYSAADALILFAQHGPPCQIESMEPGLFLTNSTVNHAQISPVWRIHTERGTFFVDPLKKAVL